MGGRLAPISLSLIAMREQYAARLRCQGCVSPLFGERRDEYLTERS